LVDEPTELHKRAIHAEQQNRRTGVCVDRLAPCGDHVAVIVERDQEPILGRSLVMARNLDAGTGRVELQPVIAAANAVAEMSASDRQRRRRR